ncbi:PARM1 protein, partial [Atractosteus spatula]|nr:PARM1 protein [Atractosteus spatula]
MGPTENLSVTTSQPSTAQEPTSPENPDNVSTTALPHLTSMPLTQSTRPLSSSITTKPEHSPTENTIVTETQTTTPTAVSMINGTSESSLAVATSPKTANSSATISSLTTEAATTTVAGSAHSPSVGSSTVLRSTVTHPNPVFNTSLATTMASRPPSTTALSLGTAQGAKHEQHSPEALSAGSVIAIVSAVIAIVVLVFGAAYYLKMRRATYGRLLDDTDYGSVGNFNNPLYEN